MRWVMLAMVMAGCSGAHRPRCAWGYVHATACTACELTAGACPEHGEEHAGESVGALAPCDGAGDGE